MQELEVTWLRTIKVWWSMVWRFIAVSTLAGIAISIVVGFGAGLLGFSDKAPAFSQALGIITGIPIGIWAVKVVLKMEYADFRVALLPSSEVLLDRQMGKQEGDR